MPFTIEEFLGVFQNYNQMVWPAQIFLYLAALLALVFVFLEKPRIVSSILAILWIWMGVVYHILNFATINTAAYLFGGVFILQGLLFAYFGIYRKEKLQFHLNLKPSSIMGYILVAYALIIYPMLNNLFGHTYPHMPTFGLPCPTTIFTFGILLFSVKRVPWYLFFIPLLWALVGFSAAVNFHIYEDFGLVIAGILGAIFLIKKQKKEFVKV